MELAPTYAAVHWVYGNILLRQGKSTEAFVSIRNAVEADKKFAKPASTTAWDIFDGDIDEVRVWNDIRSEAELDDNYLTELVGDEANLQGYWKFNNDAGVGYTSNSNDLTNENTATFTTDVPFTGAGRLEVSGRIASPNRLTV